MKDEMVRENAYRTSIERWEDREHSKVLVVSVCKCGRDLEGRKSVECGMV
jgi:hypothetical protein